ncbi:apoptosis-stimulating of p53 protein 1 isoform X7 [Danaus plexippus]|uniref:apoptosis-stimulating of p53 protein 1 isoform X7 n=1 Tax=Danaus plexippus TaxID=13037 RepID=UPI002AB06F28|nr:apoptosis-stimulating of p53 protein 1 isoform X7 [Danaus plexippus]
MKMLACVCQPTETALLFKGGPPITMGPLGSTKTNENADEVIKTIGIYPRDNNVISDNNREHSPIISIPKYVDSSGNLLNLKKIERNGKTTKILVNPVCSESVSDDSCTPKTVNTKWNGKKKRLKFGFNKYKDNLHSKHIDSGCVETKEDKKSISCFKIKSRDDKTRTNEDRSSGRENCTNENASNSLSSDKPDLIIHSRKNSNETSIDEKAVTDEFIEQIKAKKRCASNGKELGEGVELTLGELRAMALRQQQQIDTQHQLLCAKEQRLRYLKQQEARQHQVAVEGERLRRLRERVEAQEQKLRRLRALRGQLDRNKQANIALTSDLESIRALFNEKEKELSVAVAKVEELTRQLEELRRGRVQTAPPSAHELDKLRRELMYRNKLNEQQNGRLSAQRAALGARQEEMRSIDRRVSELQARLLRKRALNRQLAAAHRQPQQRTNNPTPMQQLPNYPPNTNQPKNQPARGNVAAVEPYNHVPHAQSLHNNNFQAMKQNVIQNNVPLKQLTQTDNIQGHLTQQEAHFLQQKQMMNPLYNGHYPHMPNVQDSQYQGQYNNKQDVNSFAHVQQGITNSYDQKAMFDHMNKYNEYPKQPQYSPNSTSSSNSNQTEGSRNSGGKNQQSSALKGSSPSLLLNTTSASSSIGFGILRNTASGLSASTTSTNFSGPNSSSQSILLSPPQSASTPLSTPDVSGTDKSPKPALPPKPTIKTPPRQTINHDAGFNQSNETINMPTITMADSCNDNEQQNHRELSNGSSNNEMIIKARPLTIRKPPLSEQPKLRNVSNVKNGISVSMNRRIEMPPAFLFPEMDHLNLDSVPSDVQNGQKDKSKQKDEVDRSLNNNISLVSNDREDSKDTVITDITEQVSSVDLNGQDSQRSENILRRSKKGNLKQGGKTALARRVSFDPLALLLDASLEGELELVKKTATQVQNASAANDEGITALHNAICAGHFEIVKFLVELGCDVNAQDSDGWTPLHCAASCNNLPMVRFLVDNGACIFATTLSDHETAAEKCEEDEEGFDGCSEYLYSVQEKLGIMNGGTVYAVFSYTACRPDELSFDSGARLQVLRKGDDNEREWWWCRDHTTAEGYVPRNLLGLYPRVTPQQE